MEHTSTFCNKKRWLMVMTYDDDDEDDADDVSTIVPMALVMGCILVVYYSSTLQNKT